MPQGVRYESKCVARGCGSDARIKGMCKKHYEHNRRYGTPYSKREQIDMFLTDLVANPSNECVIWPFGMSSTTGYGMCIIDGQHMTALRAAMVLLTGKNPDNLEAAHGPCHDRSCCNPHPVHGADWKPHPDNLKDKVRDQTHREGTDINFSKLCESEVIEIHRRAMAGEKYESIADDYDDITAYAVQAIASGRNWKQLGLKPIRRK